MASKSKLFKPTDKQKVSVAIALTFAFCVCELGVAFKTGSLALMADAFHYLNDLVAFVVTLAAIIVSEKENSPQHLSFGWQRARLLGAFFNGVFLLTLGISILVQSLERFISVPHVENPKLVLIIGCVGLGLNVVLIVFFHEHAHDHDHSHSHGHHHHHHADPEHETIHGADTPVVTNDHHRGHRHTTIPVKPPGRDLGMMGAMLHLIGDAVNNIGVVIVALVIWLTHSPARFYADPAVGLAIALLIFLSAVPLVRQSGRILLQSAPPGVCLDDIQHDIEQIPGIASMHELHVWSLDQQKNIATAHIVLSDPDLAHFATTAQTIRECMHAYGIHSTTLQPEVLVPVPTTDETTPLLAAAHTGLVPVPVSVPVPGRVDGGDLEEEEGGSSSATITTTTTTATNIAVEEGEMKMAPVGCQMVCGKGMCHRLLCCAPVVL